MQHNPQITLTALSAATLTLGSISLASAQEAGYSTPGQRHPPWIEHWCSPTGRRVDRRRT